MVPLREPEPVDVKVTLNSSIRPSHVQAILDSNVTTPTRKAPSVLLEEINGDSVVVRVQAVPERRADGAHLADEIIAALVSFTGEHGPRTPARRAAKGSYGAAAGSECGGPSPRCAPGIGRSPGRRDRRG